MRGPCCAGLARLHAREWLEEAKRAREQAAKLHASDLREAFERIAREYGWMSEVVERKPNGADYWRT
jgi:hypothetical protein